MGMSILLLLVISAFTAIIIWVFGRNRKARFVKDARKEPRAARPRARLTQKTFTASTAMAPHGRRMNAKIFFGHARRDGETAGRYE